jgi:hypothetical protein
MMKKKYDILAQAGVWTLYRIDTQTDDNKPIHYYQLKKDNSNGLYHTMNFQEKNLRYLKLLIDDVQLDDIIPNNNGLSNTKIVDNNKLEIAPSL